MNRPTIAVLTIGQTPRPDLVQPLADALPGREIRQYGALDGLTVADLPDGGMAVEADYPLVTRMADGTLVMVAESFVAGRLQGILDGLMGQDALVVLLCAGTFGDVRVRPNSGGVLIKPFDVGRQILDSMGMRRLGLIAPMPEQEAPIRQRWQAAGFDPVVWAHDIRRQDENFYAHLNQRIEVDGLDCIVLDYVGHDPAHVRAIQARIWVPVVELGLLAFAVVAGMVGE